MKSVRDFERSNRELFKRNREYLNSNDYTKLDNPSVSTVSSEYEVQKKIVESLLDRLKFFVSTHEVNLYDPQVQRVAKRILRIIDIHTTRVNRYLRNSNKRQLEGTAGEKSDILLLDNTLYKDISRLTTEVEKLGINEGSKTEGIRFFDGVACPLLLHSYIVKRHPEVQNLLDEMGIDFDTPPENRMLIQMHESEIPYWDPRLHYWEQTPAAIQFYVDEFKKIRNGIKLGDEYIEPWLYTHLNVAVYGIPTPFTNQITGLVESRDVFMHPPLRDNEWWIIQDNYQKALRAERHMFICATRRAAKTTVMASKTITTILQGKARVMIVSTTSGDLKELTNTIESCIGNLHPAFEIPLHGREDWGKEVEIAIKGHDRKNIGSQVISIRNTDSGSSKKNQSLAGGKMDTLVYDENMKADFIDNLNAAEPALQSGHAWRDIAILAGTGGNAELSREALEVLNNLGQYRIYEMDWELFESRIPNVESVRTWNKDPFSTFVPGQMSHRDGMRKYEIPLSEYLGYEGKEAKDFDGLVIQVTDWEYNNSVYDKEEEAIKDNKKRLTSSRVGFPRCPSHIFLTGQDHPFPVNEMQAFKTNSEAHHERREVTINKDDKGSIIFTPSTKSVSKFPFSGGSWDGPVTIFEEPIPNPPPDFYVAGLDDYNQVTADTDSIGSFLIMRRDTKKVVLTLHTRPSNHTLFHRQIKDALDAYNCKVFMENADIAFIKFLESLDASYTDRYLYRSVNFLIDMESSSWDQFKNRQFGWGPSTKNKQTLLEFVIKEANTVYKRTEETGEVVTYMGYENFRDIRLIDEMINWRPKGNFDGITALMGAIGIDFYLTYNGITFAANSAGIVDEPKQYVRIERPKAISVFGSSSGNKFTTTKSQGVRSNF